MVKASGKDFKTIRKELVSHYPTIDPAAAARGSVPRMHPQQPSSVKLLTQVFTGAVVIIDSLNAMASTIPQAMAGFLSGIITPTVSIVAVYHTDVPVLLPKTFSEYEPEPFTILCHLATAILRLSSLQQEIDRQRARNKALVEPEWGINEDREGVLIGLRRKTTAAEADESRGVVLTMELRRRSGRTVTETFVLAPPEAAGKATGKLALLSDHPMFAAPDAAGDGAEEEEPESTFNLGLTEKQRKDREGIVLPYFDAQTEVGGGDGGRILYEMGREDDFDEEEDEI